VRTEDGYLVNRCLNGEPEAFGFLVDRYKESVYSFAYAKLGNFHDAEDVTQEVFVKAYQKLRTLRRWDSFHAWIYSIAANLCKNWLRAKSRRPDREYIEDEGAKTLRASSMNSYRDELRRESLHEALHLLPEIHRQVLTLHYLGGMSTKEIARFLGTSPNAIIQRLYRARAKLKEEMLAMMNITFEEQRLPAGFTIRVVEMVKRMKIQPMPRTAGLPWGLSLAVGLIITVMSIGSNLGILNTLEASMFAPLPSETKVIESGEIPVEIFEIDQIPILASEQGDGENGDGNLLFPQRASAMGPDDEVGKFPEEPSVQLGAGDTEHIMSMAFSSDGKFLAIGEPSAVRLWDVGGQKQVCLMRQSGMGWSPNIAFSPDGKTIASCDRIGWIHIFDVDQQKEVHSWQHKSSVDPVAFSPDGKLLAWGDGPGDNQVYLWDVESRTQVGAMKGHTEHVLTVAFSPDGKLLASGARDETIRLWDVVEQKQVGSLREHTSSVDRVVFNWDGSLLASQSRNGTIYLWDVHKKKQVGSIQGEFPNVIGINGIDISPDGKILASTGRSDGKIYLWDVMEQRQLGIIVAHPGGSISVAFSPDGKWLASGGYGDKIVLLWEMNIPVPGKSVEPTGKLPGTWGKVKKTELFQNFPNPFNPETWIPYSLSKPEHVTIRIYSTTGQLVRTLDLGQKPSGAYLTKEKAAHWDGRNEAGEMVASNIYFCVMEAGETTNSRKMVVAR